MAFNVRSSVDPNAAVDKWSRKLGAAGTDWLNGYKSPRRDPQANPDKTAQAWAAGVAAAKGKFQNGIATYDSAAAIKSAEDNGVSRLTSAATNKKGKVMTFFQSYGSVISAGRAALPQDRSSYEARKARSAAMQDYLHQHPYKKSA